MGKCECRPGYTASTDDATNTTVCQPPTVILAKFLNNRTETSTVKSLDIKQLHTSSLSVSKKDNDSTDSVEFNESADNFSITNNNSEQYNYQNKNKVQAFK